MVWRTVCNPQQPAVDDPGDFADSRTGEAGPKGPKLVTTGDAPTTNAKA